MKCVKSFLGEFSSGVSVCRNKGTGSVMSGSVMNMVCYEGGLLLTGQL